MDTPTTTTDFTTFIDQERIRIKEAIKAANAKRREADAEIEELETELTAIAAYDAARKGPKASAERRAPRGRRGEKRQAILDLVAQHSDGVTRRELLDALNAHDKSGSQSVSNALSALKKAGQVAQEGKKYIARP
jgi:DNA-binding transcriptional ArsR family regulator